MNGELKGMQEEMMAICYGNAWYLTGRMMKAIRNFRIECLWPAFKLDTTRMQVCAVKVKHRVTGSGDVN
jgi:hypothetical protein